MSRFNRKENNRKPNKVIRIYTEGEKTEPDYFNSIRTELRLQEIDVRVNGCGDHTLSLVQWVLDRKNEVEGSDEETEWWVVFDKDDHTGFDEAIKFAQDNSINVAYSNECFELWFILHFEYLNTAIGRKSYNTKLTELLGKKYDKKGPNVYPLLRDKENVAIRNAKRLEKDHSDLAILSPEKRDPSTTVYLLVEKLRSLKKERDNE